MLGLYPLSSAALSGTTTTSDSGNPVSIVCEITDGFVGRLAAHGSVSSVCQVDISAAFLAHFSSSVVITTSFAGRLAARSPISSQVLISNSNAGRLGADGRYSPTVAITSVPTGRYSIHGATQPDVDVSSFVGIGGLLEAMGMTLFLYGKDVSSGGITLYTQGPLPATGEIPLFTHGIDSYTRPMNLVIVGEAPRLDSSITLFIANSGVAGYVPLFIQGSGIGEGSVPYERGMNLFLKRDPAEAMTLFLQGPGQPETSSIPLFISAAYASSGNITLAMPNVLGYLAPHITLFTRGW